MAKSVLPVFFLDANIIFSAAHSPKGRSSALFVLARKNHCRLVASKFVVEEARRNLEIKSPDALKAFQDLVEQMELVPEANLKRLERASETGLDVGDVPILAAAMGTADYLVTGDRKHFGRWMGKAIQGVKILGLAEAVVNLLNN